MEMKSVQSEVFGQNEVGLLKKMPVELFASVSFFCLYVTTWSFFQYFTLTRKQNVFQLYRSHFSGSNS